METNVKKERNSRFMGTFSIVMFTVIMVVVLVIIRMIMKK
jgi:hypothetical protein